MPPKTKMEANGTNALQHELLRVTDELKQTRAPEGAPPTVLKALDYIHHHLYDETLDATTVCIHCDLNNHNISSRFKYHVGVGMRRYIEMGRMEAAKRLLHHEHLSILQIAWSVGYTYPESFARAFKRYTGQTASEYRKKVLRRTVKTVSQETEPEHL
ncbi:helix-turn-helix domain-containing protein [Rhodocaloribacter sp.]